MEITTDRHYQPSASSNSKLSNESQSSKNDWREYSSFVSARDPFHSTPNSTIRSSNIFQHSIPFPLMDRCGGELENKSKLHVDFWTGGMMQYELPESKLLKNSFSPIKKRALKAADSNFIECSSQSSDATADAKSQDEEEGISDVDMSNIAFFDGDALSMFPKTKSFPTLSRGKMLYTNLLILSKVRKLAKCEDRLDLMSKNQKAKRPKVMQPNAENFNFTPDMFATINTKAFLHSSHLIFEVMDPVKTAEKFWDVWPVHDKKQESLYRRLALEIIKDVMKDYPMFFKSFKPEIIGGLLVHPGGERFVRLMNSLCSSALYFIAKKDAAANRKATVAMRNPLVYSRNTDITRRQLASLEDDSVSLLKATLNKENELLLQTKQHRKFVQSLQWKFAARAAEKSEMKSKIYMKCRHSELSEIAALLKPKGKKLQIDKNSSDSSLKSISTFLLDPKIEDIERIIWEKCEKTMGSIITFQDFLQTCPRMCKILSCENPKTTILDASLMFNIRAVEFRDNRGRISIDQILKNIRLKLKEVTAHPNLLANLSKQDFEKFINCEKQIALNHADARKLAATFKNMDSLEQVLDFQLEKTYIQMDGMEWSLISGLQIKPYDILQITASGDDFGDTSVHGNGNSQWDFMVSFRFTDCSEFDSPVLSSSGNNRRRISSRNSNSGGLQKSIFKRRSSLMSSKEYQKEKINASLESYVYHSSPKSSSASSGGFSTPKANSSGSDSRYTLKNCSILQTSPIMPPVSSTLNNDEVFVNAGKSTPSLDIEPSLNKSTLEKSDLLSVEKVEHMLRALQNSKSFEKVANEIAKNSSDTPCNSNFNSMGSMSGSFLDIGEEEEGILDISMDPVVLEKSHISNF